MAGKIEALSITPILISQKIGSNMTTATDKRFSPREYWEKRLSEKWGLHGVGHISYGRPYNKWLYRVRRRVFLRQLRQLPVQLSESSVLDIGSGTGFWLKMWRSAGVPTVVGSDLTHVAVENLRKENPGTSILELDITDSEAVGRIEQRFDLISAFDVLFHVTKEADFARSISNVAKLLKPGGYFMFSDNLLHIRTRRAVHEVDRTIDDFARELTRSGLQIRSRVPVFVLMNSPVDLPFELPQHVWRLLMSPVHFLPALGHLYGGVLYPLEIALTQLLRESPSTEMMICQKFRNPAGSENTKA